MKNFIILSLFVISGNVCSQTLSAEEQKQMIEDMKVMKERINKLESGKPTSGLKKVNYENETAETKTQAAPSPSESSISPEQTKKLMEDINALKLKQAEAQKVLDQLDKEEEAQSE